tara:strand:+ start:153 stop:938 length:786 start_codon:yes stop_codon:yes gene_type:complete
MKKIVLFDMDGTLTPARKRLEWNVLDSLIDLQRADIEIGIVTGSDMDYVKQQMDIAFDISALDPSKLHYLPCNGTKYYRMKYGKFVANYENDMRKKIGGQNWQRLVKLLTNLQSAMSDVYNVPLTGSFINYRGSMINWCPIGRQCTDEDRINWVKQDKNQNIREKWITITRDGLDNAGLQDVIIKLGGDTSFDIYPYGWDKTFAFNNFDGYKIYFVGDRCDVNGNDREAYLKAGPLGYSTSGPEETRKIISNIIEKEKVNE